PARAGSPKPRGWGWARLASWHRGACSHAVGAYRRGMGKGQAAHKQRNNISRKGVDSPSIMWLIGLNATGMVPGVTTRGANIMAKEITISLGKAGSIVVDLDKLQEHPQVVEYVFNYGLKQMLN